MMKETDRRQEDPHPSIPMSGKIAASECHCFEKRTHGRKVTNDEEETTTTEEDSGLWELSFLFEADLPSRRERFHFETDAGKRLEIVLDSADDEPGALQSGQYLWPASQVLAKYFVQTYARAAPSLVVELGAGCGLCACTAWQLWSNSLHCLVVTDRDPGALERARNNHETTLEELLDQNSETEDALNATINNLGSTPTFFETLEWGNTHDTQIVQDMMAEYSLPTQRHTDFVLGSDLIYDISVVEPLLQTVLILLTGGANGRFLLAQSFVFDPSTEEEIDRCCAEFGLARRSVYEDASHSRIQEFQLA